MTAADRRLLAELPPELTAAHILRQGLAGYRSQAAECPHEQVRCDRCGELLERGEEE